MTTTKLPEQTTNHMVVIDVECTTDDNGTGADAHEIIEWPAILVDRARREVVATFHEYVVRRVFRKGPILGRETENSRNSRGFLDMGGFWVGAESVSQKELILGGFSRKDGFRVGFLQMGGTWNRSLEGDGSWVGFRERTDCGTAH